MCNLSGSLGPADINVLKILLIAGENRGKDSTGVLMNHKIVKFGSKKDYGPYEWITDYNYSTKQETPIVMQHNRAATVGTVNEKTAQPFEIGEPGKRLFLMHNGTISNHFELSTRYAIQDYLTDSHLIAQIIHSNSDIENGIVYTDILKEYEGAAALIFYFEQRPDELYIFRGKSFHKKLYTWENSEERPLSLYLHDQTLYWASKDWQLKVAIPFEDYEEACLVEAPTNKVMKYKLADGKLTEETIAEIDRESSNGYDSYKSTQNLYNTYDEEEWDVEEDVIRLYSHEDRSFYKEACRHLSRSFEYKNVLIWDSEKILLNGEYPTGAYDVEVSDKVKIVNTFKDDNYTLATHYFIRGFRVKHNTYARFIKNVAKPTTFELNNLDFMGIVPFLCSDGSLYTAAGKTDKVLNSISSAVVLDSFRIWQGGIAKIELKINV